VSYFVGRPQIVADEPDIPFNGVLQHDVAIPREQLDANFQFGRPGYGSHCPSRFAARTVLFNQRLQDKRSSDIVGIRITAAERERAGNASRLVEQNFRGNTKRIHVYTPFAALALLHYVFKLTNVSLRIQIAEVVYRHNQRHPNAFDLFLACTLPLAQRAAQRKASEYSYIRQIGRLN
jgi:hypothetical protein